MALPARIANWLLTSLKRRLVKTGGHLVKPARSPAGQARRILPAMTQEQRDFLKALGGIEQERWDAAKRQARELLEDSGRRGRTTNYLDLTRAITEVRFAPGDFLFFNFLGQLSEESDANGEGLISALVINKKEGMPGSGFFTLARKLGRTDKDDAALWAKELHLVIERIHA